MPLLRLHESPRLDRAVTFVCESCGKECEAGPEDEAEEEYQKLWPLEARSNLERARVCDDCFNQFLQWYAKE